MGKYSICAKHLPNMARYPHQHLEMPQLPMAVLEIDATDCLPIISKGNKWAFTAFYLHASYMFAVVMKEISAENVVQAYLSGVLSHKGGSVAILSDNGTAFKNKVLNEVCKQLHIKRLFSNPFYPQGNAKVENVHNFLKRTLTKFLYNSNVEWDALLPFTWYCYNIFTGSNGTKLPFFLMLDKIKQKDAFVTLATAINSMEPMKGK